MLVPLLEKLGVLTNHPGLLQPHALSSIGKYLNELNFDAYREWIVTATGLFVTHKVRSFELITCEVADKLPTAQRRQCMTVRGTNELARRLEAKERGGAEVTVTFTNGGTLSVIQHRDPRRMIVFLTSVHKVKKALDAKLEEVDAPALAQFFEEASKGQRQAAISHSPTTRHMQLEGGSFWILPAWYAEAIGILAQDVFRLHAFVSAISATTSRALFIDRVTGHRLERGEVHEHRTLIKASMHRWSGGVRVRRSRHRPTTRAVSAARVSHGVLWVQARRRQVPHAFARGVCAAVGALPGHLHARPEGWVLVHAPRGVERRHAPAAGRA